MSVPNQIARLSYLRWCTIDELAELLGLSERVIRYQMVNLEQNYPGRVHVIRDERGRILNVRSLVNPDLNELEAAKIRKRAGIRFAPECWVWGRA